MAEKASVAMLIAVFRNGECKGCTFNDQAAAALELLVAECKAFRLREDSPHTDHCCESVCADDCPASNTNTIEAARAATDARLILDNDRKGTT